MAASLNDIYKSIGELTGIVKGLSEKIEENERRNTESIRRADESRANVHRRLDDLVLRTTHLESDMQSTKSRVEEMGAVTDDVVKMRHKADGAGTLGRWLIRIGIGVVSVGGWIVGAYTYLTGRPPP
jgi:hypothetical protein